MSNLFKFIGGNKKKDTTSTTETTVGGGGEQQPQQSDKHEKPEIYSGGTNSDGKYHGFGELLNLQTNNKYEGYWVNGVKEGTGMQFFPTGERYDGQWRNNNMDGEGIVFYPNGDKFEGTWKDGRRVKGTFYCHENGVVFRENWTINDTPGSEGQIDFNTGGKYIGEIKYVPLGKHQIKNYSIFRDGFGEMYYSNSYRYIGFWKNDMRKGFGVLIQNNGPKYYGNWHRGKKTGHGIQIEQDGTFYEGFHQQDERKGSGKLCLPNGDNIHGEWHGNKEAKLTTALYTSGKFTDAPRPVRALFLAHVTGVQRSEDTSMFTSLDKWGGFFHTILDIINSDYTLERFQETLNPTNITNFASHMNDPITDTLTRFIKVINWIYSNTHHTKKDLLFHKQTAIDDISSFVCSLSDFLEQRMVISYPNNKKIYEALVAFIFPQIYDTIFPLYISVNKSKDTILQAKIEELKDVTTAIIGVKPRYHLLEKSPPVTPNSDSEKSQRRPVAGFNPISPRPSILQKISENEDDPATPPHAPHSSRPNAISTSDSSELRTPNSRTPSRIGVRGNDSTQLKTNSSTSSLTSKSEPSEESDDDSSEPQRPRRPAFTISSIATSKRDHLPYQRVIDVLKKIELCKTPKEKIDCLTSASQLILTCVDEANPDKTKQIVMGAEDKFPILIYALIRANIPNLWSHSFFIQDFIEERLGDEESKYRISELVDALKYIQSLDWNLRDSNDVLFPLQMAISAVSWEAFKGVEKIKFSDESNVEYYRIQLQLCASTIFRLISQRTTDIYSPFLVPNSLSTFLKDYESYYQSIFSKEVGLVLRREDIESDNSFKYWIEFELKHPLYVYERLSVACVENESK